MAWLLIPFLILVIWMVLVKARSDVSKLNGKNAIVGIVVAIVVLSAYYFLRYVAFPE